MQKITQLLVQNIKIRVKQLERQKIYPTRNPLRQIYNYKRLSNYKNQKTIHKPETQLDMTQSRLSKLNQEIEQRTKYFLQHSKYDSRWGQQHQNNFINQRFSEHQKSPSNSRNISQFRESEQRQYYRPRTPIQNTYQFITPQYQHYSDRHLCPRVDTETYYYGNRDYSNTHMRYKGDEAKQNLSKDKDFTKYTFLETKESAKDQARQAKQQIKDKIKQQAKQIVGSSNYQVMSDIGHPVAQLKDNDFQEVQQSFGQVYDSLKQTKNPVVDQIREVKEFAKQAVKPVVGTQNFQLMKYITDLIEQLKRNLIRRSPVSENTSQQVQKLKQTCKSESFGQVSPIQYSQRSFSRAPVAQKGNIWIYTLITIGIFLVIFQILK